MSLRGAGHGVVRNPKYNIRLKLRKWGRGQGKATLLTALSCLVNGCQFCSKSLTEQNWGRRSKGQFLGDLSMSKVSCLQGERISKQRAKPCSRSLFREPKNTLTLAKKGRKSS